jgi:hypothetical protein
MVRTGTILLITFIRLWDLLNDQQYGFVILIYMIQDSVMDPLSSNVVDQILACVIDESVGISTMALEDGVQVAMDGLISIIYSENICIIVQFPPAWTVSPASTRRPRARLQLPPA